VIIAVRESHAFESFLRRLIQLSKQKPVASDDGSDFELDERTGYFTLTHVRNETPVSGESSMPFFWVDKFRRKCRDEIIQPFHQSALRRDLHSLSAISRLSLAS
jgi:hypothetical protein